VQPKRLKLIHYDVVRELCDECRQETFHFVPIGTAPATRLCKRCGNDGHIADMTETSIFRLVTRDDGEVVVVPRIA
jgi:NMD protein affecting ribosome stability and mRNA decay